MTLDAWLGQRTPAPPPRLAARIGEALGARRQLDVAQAPEACIEAAGEMLRELLARPSAGRESALDLLTVDSLVTYAFEAAAEDPASLPARAAAAMTRLASAGGG